MSWLSIFQGCPLGSTVLLDMVHVNMKWLAALKWGAKNNSRCPLLHSLPIPSFLIFVAMCKCMTVVTGTAVLYCAPWGHPKCSSVNRLERNTSNCIGQHSDAPCTDEKKKFQANCRVAKSDTWYNWETSSLSLWKPWCADACQVQRSLGYLVEPVSVFLERCTLSSVWVFITIL